MMHESPIELIITEVMTEIAKQQEEQVMRAVQGVGVNVNKEELLMALAYDRQQYQKGYEDGIRAFAERLIEEKSKHEIIYDTTKFLCNLANEMLGYVAFKVIRP